MRKEKGGWLYLWVGFDNGQAARAVRLLGVRPEEVVVPGGGALRLDGLGRICHELLRRRRGRALCLGRLGDGRGGGGSHGRRRVVQTIAAARPVKIGIEKWQVGDRPV